MADDPSSNAKIIEAINSAGKDIPSVVGTGTARVIRYENHEILKEHVAKLAGGSSKLINGMTKLKIAAGDTDETKLFLQKEKVKPTARETDETKPQLRRGQIIFGSVSLAHAYNAKNPITSYFLNLFAPIIMKFETGEARESPYLHVAVYAGKFEGRHYVIENGGGFTEYLHPHHGLIGMISVVPMDEAFEEDAKFFVMSPPKDSKVQSTRQLVLQRALACLGTFYYYHLRSVNCEGFAMIMMKLNLEPQFEPVQGDVLRPFKGYETDEAKDREDQKRFKKFYGALLKKVEEWEDETILTLDYYLRNEVGKTQKEALENCRDVDKLNENVAGGMPWWHIMDVDYDLFADAVKQQNLKEVQDLINKGLNINSNLRGEPRTAIAYADAKGFTALAKLLESKGAKRKSAEELANHAKKHD